MKCSKRTSGRRGMNKSIKFDMKEEEMEQTTGKNMRTVRETTAGRTTTSPVCSLRTKLRASRSGPATRRRNSGFSPSASLHTYTATHRDG